MWWVGRRASRDAKGMALGTVLMVAAVAAVAAFTMAALCTTHLNFAQRYAGLRDAQYLAESAIARAIYQVHDDATWGTKGTERTVVQPDPGDDRRLAVLTFDTSAGLPHSTNNIDGSNSDSYGHEQIPAGSVRLVAVGQSRGARATVDVVLTRPRFPYVVACSGPFQSIGALIVKGATSMQDVVAQEQGASPPSSASMGCNSSVTSTQAASITGDVVAAGKVSLPAGSSVGGEIRQGTIELPYIDPTSHDPSGVPGATRVPPGGGPLSLTGQNFTNGDLVVHGNLTLSGGLLYVKGNLTVNGGLQGSGAVMVTGATTINGGADLAATNLVALLSEGDITFNGNPGARKYFQGLVYTQGALTASNITLAGTLVAGGSQGVALGAAPLGSGGGMTLTNVTAIYIPEVAALNLNVGPSSSDPKLISSYTSMGNSQQITVGEYLPSASACTAPDSVKSSVTSALFAHTTRDADNGVTWMEPAGGAPYGMYYTTDASQPGNVGSVVLGVVQLVDPHDHQHSLLQAYVSALIVSHGRYSVDGSPNVSYFPTEPPNGTVTLTPDVDHPLTDQQAEAIAKQHGTTTEAMVAFALDKQRAFADAANHALSLYGSGGGASIDLTLNKFLRDTTPFRIISWKLW